MLNINNAGSRIADRLAWDREKLRLALTLTGIGPIGIGPPIGGGVKTLNLDGASIEAFFSYKDAGKLGLALRIQMRAGLRGDPMLQQIIPEQAPTVQTSSIAIALDTKDGLTFGDGPNRKVTLPVRFNFPGVELREMAIGLPETKDPESGRIDLMVTIAGKLGDTLGIVAEGGGVIMRWKGEPNEAVDVLPKPPYAAGLRVRSGLVNGGGFLRYKEDKGEYGGMLDLQFGHIGITAFGLYRARSVFAGRRHGHRLPAADRAELRLHAQWRLAASSPSIGRFPRPSWARRSSRAGSINCSSRATRSPPLPRFSTGSVLVFPEKPGGFVVGPIGAARLGIAGGIREGKARRHSFPARSSGCGARRAHRGGAHSRDTARRCAPWISISRSPRFSRRIISSSSAASSTRSSRR